MILEDLGPARDASKIYQDPRALSLSDLSDLLDALTRLHALSATQDPPSVFDNRAMRQLNHQHIFQIPFQENDLDLDAITPGLKSDSLALRSKNDLMERIAILGEKYLKCGPTLIHGDFYPASFLHRSNGRLAIIDAEFCLLLEPEFDYAVLLAHLFLAGFEALDPVLEGAAKNGHDLTLTRAYAGVEILRRLCGVAQLPLRASREQKQEWIARACDWVQELPI